MKTLWTEQYRPKTLDGYVFKDSDQKSILQSWIDEKNIPNLLISGPAGTGKTTIAKILLNELDVQPSDILYANGSKEGRKIEWVDKLINFCQVMPFGDTKVVLIDESDYMNLNSVQPALRNLMEEYSSTVRFIMTCNYPQRLMPPIISRCQHLHIDKIDKTEFTARMAEILISENITFDLDVLDIYVNAYYPDLRKCINTVQLNSTTGTLTSQSSSSINADDYKIKMVELYKQGKVRDARKLICSQVLPEEIEDVYRWLYNNLELFGDEDKQEQAILIIKQGLVDHAMVVDPEINLAAVLIKLGRL
jgi:DNA polymerase III delta prime subunit